MGTLKGSGVPPFVSPTRLTIFFFTYCHSSNSASGKTAGLSIPQMEKYSHMFQTHLRKFGKAISAAKTAFHSWKKTSFKERAACMKKFVDGLKSRQKEFAALTLERESLLGRPQRCLRASIPYQRLMKDDLLKPEVNGEDKRGE